MTTYFKSAWYYLLRMRWRTTGFFCALQAKQAVMKLISFKWQIDAQETFLSQVKPECSYRLLSEPKHNEYIVHIYERIKVYLANFL